MSTELIEIKSITEVHQLFKLGNPDHPLISLLDVSKIDFSTVPKNIRIRLELYSIWLKDAHCGVQYGRNHFDFNIIAFYSSFSKSK